MSGPAEAHDAIAAPGSEVSEGGQAKTLPEFITHLGITMDEYQKLCLRAFENLPPDTTVTIDDVDSVLTWCLPEYIGLRAAHAGDPAGIEQFTASYALMHGHSGPYAREEMAAAFRSGYLAACPPGFAPDGSAGG